MAQSVPSAVVYQAIITMAGGTVPHARCKKYHKKGDTLACTALFVIRWLQAAPSSVQYDYSTVAIACQGGSEKKMEGRIEADCTRRQAPRSIRGSPGRASIQNHILYAGHKKVACRKPENHQRHKTLFLPES